MKLFIASSMFFFSTLWALTAFAAVTKPSTTITGYGDLVLGKPVGELNLDGYSEPILQTGPESDGTDGRVVSYLKETNFTSGGRTVKMQIILFTLDSNLEVIWLRFPDLVAELDDIDSIGLFCTSIRDTLARKYDAKLWDRTKDHRIPFHFGINLHWSAITVFRDADLNELTEYWNGSLLTISYDTKKWRDLQQVKTAQAAEETSGKL